MTDIGREIQAISDEIAKAGGTPLAVAKDSRRLGAPPKNIVKGGIRERFAELRRKAHRDDHGRQPDDRGGDRRRSRRR